MINLYQPILFLIWTILAYLLGLFNGAEIERKRGWNKGIDAIKRTANKLNKYEKQRNKI